MILQFSSFGLILLKVVNDYLITAYFNCFFAKVRQIASEFYDDLPCHTSWVKVIWDFICRPDIGPYARVKRRDTALANGDVGDKTD
jgi:hypothetical protein